jgi:hypothetical protein
VVSKFLIPGGPFERTKSSITGINLLGKENRRRREDGKLSYMSVHLKVGWYYSPIVKSPARRKLLLRDVSLSVVRYERCLNFCLFCLRLGTNQLRRLGIKKIL